ncbi:hypothetical protein A9Q81_11790 [Gammaproteobacteria bacterium 42_54_T18]|nr:hypothetical protein A9Q81_11790 [Gammaproteobacteria bacterium 42_54_T18]
MISNYQRGSADGRDGLPFNPPTDAAGFKEYEGWFLDATDNWMPDMPDINFPDGETFYYESLKAIEMGEA